MSRPRRTCTVPGCGKPRRGLGYCCMHYFRFRRTGQTATNKTERRDATVEDAAELAAQRETLDSAARRLGRTPDALERTLCRAGRADLVSALKGHPQRLRAVS